jgi:hypothetical protein
MPVFALRETVPVGLVQVIVDGKVVHRNLEYRGAAIFVQQHYGLSDDEVMALYRPYKDHYDSL